MTARLVNLYRFPVKGLSPEPLQSIAVKAGETLPYDRAWAIENGPGRFDPQKPKHLPKISFLMLMRDERLATLRTSFDEDSQTLTINRDGKQVARGQLTTALGRKMIEQFLSAYMSESLRGAAKVVSSPGHSFSDVAEKCVHIINLATVEELQRSIGKPVDPLRFRANLYIDGLAPWEEFKLSEQEFQIGDEVVLQGIARTVRCDATNVDPQTGARDLSIPVSLKRTWDHQHFGIYAKVKSGGTLTVGNEIKAHRV